MNQPITIRVPADTFNGDETIITVQPGENASVQESEIQRCRVPEYRAYVTKLLQDGVLEPSTQHGTPNPTAQRMHEEVSEEQPATPPQ